MLIVAVGSIGGIGDGEGVSVGRVAGEAVALKTRSGDACVGVYSRGWNGVGVGEASGAEVIK